MSPHLQITHTNKFHLCHLSLFGLGFQTVTTQPERIKVPSVKEAAPASQMKSLRFSRSREPGTVLTVSDSIDRFLHVGAKNQGVSYHLGTTLGTGF